ncbi:acetyl-CoA hydrolase [Gilvimarinus agarilyticus]|uniref:acetyl-CoA hydrolase/transferase C-terminal domain-containing protein n=1 Tax=Gilvimarinus sp. 2_MG-2023 TaxID=3062666 RepID=UPI001C08EC28|nr:acetyl-CoA hydrolase/transferase C-terminal domain-containing protein [Gilvimarinus sp. 2_MG-2023]MBU2886537.1 acetyl-CoA hydrolase [Gilvimarinus agarilyticus]MDO6571205.1 acetyl-CoA hydrolase/transferase C-terminal domain-containing protein [Gilvimarinus sp. 2_MG-2023]
MKPCSSPDTVVDEIIERVGKHIVLGLPLGLGKANHLVNALYQRACIDTSLTLNIYTALTLEPPTAPNELGRRFLEPLQERFFAGYPRLEYAQALKDNSLPSNISVTEFFLQPAAWIGCNSVQQNYTSVNYTHALDYLISAGVNVITQQVAPEHSHGALGEHYSLSSNPDISVDLLDKRSRGKIDFVMAAQVNRQLPFLGGAAVRDSSELDLVLDDPAYDFALFMPPHQPVSNADHAIALHCTRLIADGGTLQIGIGSIGDAIAAALVLRHNSPQAFKQLTDQLQCSASWPNGESEPFKQGLYGLSEMLVEGFIELLEAGILKRTVNGYCLHAGFFMGSPLFYRQLQALPQNKRDQIAMMPVNYINDVHDHAHGSEQDKRQARQHARFINCAMKATTDGAVTSDGLENGQVISGVGGQYDFVAQAHTLQNARSIITVRATRKRAGKVSSNIVSQYGHTTIPRHLRDIVATEYGVADLRGKSDAEVIAAMIEIADSRFQEQLVSEAKAWGKLPQSYQVPAAFCRNTPEHLNGLLAGAFKENTLKHFPLGSDFTDTEQRLSRALNLLSETVGTNKATVNLLRLGLTTHSKNHLDELTRMELAAPSKPTEKLYQLLLLGALRSL